MEKRRTLARDLQAWATSEMHYTPQGRYISSRPPGQHDFEDVCIGKMTDVWEFLIGRVRSAQTVRKIRGNLALRSIASKSSADYKVSYKSGQQYSDERGKLLEQRRHLVAEVGSLMTDISVVENDLHRLQRDVLQAESSNQESVEVIEDIRRREMLLWAHTQRCEEDCITLDELSRRISSKVQQARDAANNSEDTVYYNQNIKSNDTTGLESACSRQVTEVCTTLGTFLHKMLTGEFTSDPSLLQKSKEDLWLNVETLLSNHAIQSVVEALITNTRNSTRSLREDTLKIDISRDAQALSFRYDQGQLTDLSNQPSVLQSVRQLIEEAQRAHVSRFFETEKHKNAAWKLENRLTQARETIQDQLRQTMKGKPEALQLATKLIELEIQLAASNANLNVFTEALSELQQKMDRLSHEKQELYHKYQKIQNFKTVTETKQNLIRVLIKQNVSSRENMLTQQNEIKDYIEKKSLSAPDAAVTELIERLQGGVSAEVQKFTSLSLLHLLFTSTGDGASKTAVLDLSINRLSRPLTSTGHQVIDQLITAIGFPVYKAPECLLSHAVDQLNAVHDLEATLKIHKSLLEGMSGEEKSQTALIKHIEELCSEVKARDTDEILPMLQKRISQVSQVLLDCIQVKDTVQAWWEQPAQHTTPNLTVQQLTLQQWRDKWTYHVARLRQLQLQQKP